MKILITTNWYYPEINRVGTSVLKLVDVNQTKYTEVM